jgi:hypothetical protein
MARTPTKTKEQQVDLEEAIQASLAPATELAHLADAQAIAHAVQADYTEDRDELNQILGQIQMGRAFSKFADVCTLSKLAHIKETKKYKALAGKRGIDIDGNEIPDVGTWEGFCLAVGTTRSKVDEDLTNLRMFGETALADLSRVGAGYRELRQLRKLPDDEKTALLEAAKTGDKDAYIDLAEEIISKHAKEKAEAAKKLDDQQKDFQALEAVAKTHKEENNQLRMELEKSKLQTLPWSDVVAPLAEEIANHQAIIDKALDRHLQAISAIDVWHTGLIADAATDDPYAHVPLPQEAVTVLMSLEDAINRSAHAIAAIRDHLQNEFGAVLMDARRHLLIESEE